MRLTDEQIDRAAEAMWRSWDGAGLWEHWFAQSGYRLAVKTTAPFLQILWDEATDDEAAAMTEWYGHGSESMQSVLNEFLRRRNAGLMPKSVDAERNAIELRIDELLKTAFAKSREITLRCLREYGVFVEPVDPRVAKLAKVIKNQRDQESLRLSGGQYVIYSDTPEELATKLIAALDKE